MTDQILRAIIFSNKPLSGYLKYKDLFQFIPSDESWYKPPAFRGDHPILLEFSKDIVHKFNFSTSYLSGWSSNNGMIPDRIMDSTYADKVAFTLTTLLTTITNELFFLYRPEQSWFIPLEQQPSERKILWGQKEYIMSAESSRKYSGEDFSLPECGEAKITVSNEYYNKYGARLNTVPIGFPENISILIDKYFSLPNDIKSKFDSACILFYQAVSLACNNTGLSTALLASSLETLVNVEKYDPENCRECGQPRYRISKRFREFVIKYSGNNSKLKKFANTFYEWRSKISHEGLFFTDMGVPLVNPVNRERFIVVTRICIVNWLISQQ